MFKKMLKWISDAWINWLNHERPNEGLPLCDFERIRYELRIGDVLLIEGRSRVSDIIRSITQSSWSHSALYIGRLHDIEDPKIRNLISSYFKTTPDTQLIVEGIMGKGAIINPLSVYEHDHIRVCRPRGLSRQDAQHIISHAIQKLGYEYDVRQVFDLARFMLPWKLFPGRLGSKLFLEHNSENTKIVCSTMIAEAFASVDFPILPLVKAHDTKGVELIARNTKLYTPRDFDYSPYFDIMKYPYIELANHTPYRKLPWNREGLVSHDSVGVHSRKSKAAIPASSETTFLDEMNAEVNRSEDEVDTQSDVSGIHDNTLDSYVNTLISHADRHHRDPYQSDASLPLNDSYSTSTEREAFIKNSLAVERLAVKKKPVETPPSA